MLDERKTTSSSSTTTGTTFYPDMMEYWKNNLPKYVETVGELIEILQRFPKETNILVKDGCGGVEFLTEDWINIKTIRGEDYIVI